MTRVDSYTATEWLEHATKQLNSLHALFKANDWQPDCTLIEGLTTATGQINEAMQLLRSSGPERDVDAQFIAAIRNLVNGGPFDLTDSPKSLSGNVVRLVNEYDAAIRSSATAERPDLKPCPFCGHGARWGDVERGEAWGSYKRHIICSSSHCRASVELPLDLADENNGESLARMWNRRQSLTPSAVAYVDRGDAVNLARNALEDEHMMGRVSRTGIRTLCEAVMKMDEALRLQSASGEESRCPRCKALLDARGKCPNSWHHEAHPIIPPESRKA